MTKKSALLLGSAFAALFMFQTTASAADNAASADTAANPAAEKHAEAETSRYVRRHLAGC